MCLALTPGHSQFFNVHEKSGRAWYATACEWRFTWNRPGIDIIVHGSDFRFLSDVLSSLILVFRSLEVRFDKIKRDQSESNQRLFQIHLTSWIGWSPRPSCFSCECWKDYKTNKSSKVQTFCAIRQCCEHEISIVVQSLQLYYAKYWAGTAQGIVVMCTPSKCMCINCRPGTLKPKS